MNSFTKNQNLSIYYAATPSRAKVGKQSQAFVSEKNKKFEIVKFDFNGWLSRLAKLEHIPTSLIAYFKIFIGSPSKESGNQRFLRPYDTSDIVKINNIINGFNHSIRRLNEDYPSIIDNFHHVNRDFIQKAERSFGHLKKGMEAIQEWFRLAPGDPDFIQVNKADIQQLRFEYNDINQKMRNMFQETGKLISKYNKLFERKGRGEGEGQRSLFLNTLDDVEVNWKFR